MIVNRAQLSRTLSRQAPKALGREFERKVRRAVIEAQRLMISEFESHPVTQEIARGPSASNLSNTLAGSNVNANLFSFIGFDSGSNPVDKIRMYLAQNLEIRRVSGGKNKVALDFVVRMPSLGDVYNLSPVPWAPGLSWAEGIERGLPGLGQYLATPNQGRSGGGIQVKAMLSGASFKSVPYLSKILKDFVNNLLSVLR